MSDRILGAVCVLVAAGMAWAAQGYAAAISYEPVGPRAFPLLLSGLMGVAGLWLVFKPGVGKSAAAFDAGNATRIGISALSIMAYAALFQTLGFIVATTLVALPVGMAFGGRWKQSLLGGLGLGVALFFLFDKLLDVVLPTGVLSFLLGGH
ncbi:MAG: tripartite tricarboxylate transporter TctB family protein [Polaromonas sp.]